MLWVHKFLGYHDHEDIKFSKWLHFLIFKISRKHHKIFVMKFKGHSFHLIPKNALHYFIFFLGHKINLSATQHELTWSIRRKVCGKNIIPFCCLKSFNHSCQWHRQKNKFIFLTNFQSSSLLRKVSPQIKEEAASFEIIIQHYFSTRRKLSREDHTIRSTDLSI